MPNKLVAAGIGVIMFAALAGCSSDGGKTASSDTTAAQATTTVAPAPAKLTMVVTDDDGIGAPGFDQLVTALKKMENVDVIVVAPAKNQSGTGAKTTPGDVKYSTGKTASGIEGTAVDGFPADSVHVALDELKLKPNLVVSGINRGQNVGPLSDLSGTVGAALTAARRGVPAIAGSAGTADNADYASAITKVIDWIEQNRQALTDGTAAKGVVININVPQCTTGEPREMLDVTVAEKIPEGVNPFAADCAAAFSGEKPTDDVNAIAQGFISRSEIKVEVAKS